MIIDNNFSHHSFKNFTFKLSSNLKGLILTTHNTYNWRPTFNLIMLLNEKWIISGNSLTSVITKSKTTRWNDILYVKARRNVLCLGKHEQTVHSKYYERWLCI